MADEDFVKSLHTQLAYWQKVLYLQDWTVELRIVRQWEMADTGTLAQCHWYIQRKDAVISVLDPQDLAGVAPKFLNSEECDYDISIVHELLHLHFAPFHREEDETSHEQAINAISRGMVKIYREDEAHKPDPKPIPHSGHYL